MKPTIFKLMWRGLVSFNLVEFILPPLNILLGLGITKRTVGHINIGYSLQFILFITFLETGSQFFQFYKNIMVNSAKGKKDEKARSAILMLVILFYALCLLPLNQLFVSQQNNPPFLIISAIAAFLSIMWRNLGSGAIPELISRIFFLLNNAFFLPLSQLSMFGVEINRVFVSIFQFLFLLLFAFLFMREIYQIEIIGNESSIVKLVGTIPIWRISVITLLLGGVLFTIFALRQSVTELKIAALLFILLVIPVLRISISPFIQGKKGLITSYRLTQLISAGIYLGLFFFLWVN